MPEKYAPVLREEIPNSGKRDPDWGEAIPTLGNHALDLRHNIPTWGWSAPNLGQGFQTLGRLLSIQILCDIIAGTYLVNAGQVAVTEDPCLRKTGRQFPDQFCHAPLLGHGAYTTCLSPLCSFILYWLERILFHLRHLECGGIGSAILAPAQGRPLHHTVLDALYLPPLAQFLTVG